MGKIAREGFAPVGDLVKAAEALAFGAYGWAVEQLAGFESAPDLERVAIEEERLRALHAMEQADDADAAALALALAEANVKNSERLAQVRLARDKLLSGASLQEQEIAAPAFLAAFEAAWVSDREGLVFDAALAAVVRANVLKTQVHRALEIYDALAEDLNARIARGETFWLDTARSANNRIVVALRAEEGNEKARRARERARQFDPG